MTHTNLLHRKHRPNRMKNRFMELLRLSIENNTSEQRKTKHFRFSIRSQNVPGKKLRTVSLATLHTLGYTNEIAEDGVTQNTSFWTHSFPMPGTNQRLTMALAFACSKASIENLTEKSNSVETEK